MDLYKTILEPFVKRTELVVGTSYKKVDGTKLGVFVKSYYSGSGDGMCVHYTFKLDGKENAINADLWGTQGIVVD